MNTKNLFTSLGFLLIAASILASPHVGSNCHTQLLPALPYGSAANK